MAFMKTFLAFALCAAVTIATMPFTAKADTPPATAPAEPYPATGEHATASDHAPAIFGGVIAVLVLGTVVASRKKARPFVGRLTGLPPGALPGTALKNGDAIHGMLETGEDGKERYVIDSHLGPIEISEANINLDLEEPVEGGPRDYKDLKGEALDAELAARNIDGDKLKADEKRQALMDYDRENPVNPPAPA